MRADHLAAWAPLSVAEVAARFARVPFPWWIAGGWAIDLFVGRQTRAHGDLDVVVLRPNQIAAQAALGDWDLHAADPPGALRVWRRDERLPAHVHDIWCRPSSDAPWALQLMLLDTEADRWVFRRDRRVAGAIDDLGRRNTDGVPFLAPEVPLLFKSKALRPQDEADFAVALPLLSTASRRWLRDALALHAPEHPWLAPLHNADDHVQPEPR